MESSHHENAPAQHEIDFKYDEALQTADNISTFKLVVKTIAKRHGLHATFMPKPRAEVNGSGMHIHFALYKDGKNIFADPDDVNGLSEDAYHFIGGLLAHSEEMAAITNPLVNSYKRLVPGYDAPTELTWTKNNQNSLIRISNLRSDSLAIELRSQMHLQILTLCLLFVLQPVWMEFSRNYILPRHRIVLFPNLTRKL